MKLFFQNKLKYLALWSLGWANLGFLQSCDLACEWGSSKNCDSENPENQTSTQSATDPEKELGAHSQEQSIRSGPYVLRWQNVAPALEGDAWSRRFQIESTDPLNQQPLHRWAVEKREWGGSQYDRMDWVVVGDTNGVGVFYDFHVDQVAQYRFGEILETDSLPALRDLQFSRQLCGGEIRVYRLLIPAHIKELRDCGVSIQAHQLVLRHRLRIHDPYLESSISYEEIQGGGSVQWIRPR